MFLVEAKGSRNKTGLAKSGNKPRSKKEVEVQVRTVESCINYFLNNELMAKKKKTGDTEIFM